VTFGKRPTTIRTGSVWKFKDGRGDPYRRLRVKHVQSAAEPVVEVRSFYLDEGSWPSDDDVRNDPRRRAKTITILRSTLLKDYECVTTLLEREGPIHETVDQVRYKDLY
jgi:hypothetical protein